METFCHGGETFNIGMGIQAVSEGQAKVIPHFAMVIMGHPPSNEISIRMIQWKLVLAYVTGVIKVPPTIPCPLVPSVG